MEDSVLEVGAIGELPKAEEVAVVAHAIKGLVERGEALLAIQNEEGVLRAVERRGAFELAGREHTLGITHTQDAPSRIVARDRDDQLLGGARLPDKIALEVRKHGRAVVDLGEEVLQSARIGVLKETHVVCPIPLCSIDTDTPSKS